MKNMTLVIMAAGIGSRFDGGIKQLEPVGPNGELIMEYSIHDALEANFNKIVFIIRKEIEKEFKESIGNRIEKICEVAYVFQELDDLPYGFEKPKDRVKPWGTGQAILCCKNMINEPFIIINADDYYGKEAFLKTREFLNENYNSKYQYCMAGFILKNTLSKNGGVTRGICSTSQDSMLIHIDETSNIEKSADGISTRKNGKQILIDPNIHVSMNMWGVTPDFIELLEIGFIEFLSNRNQAEDMSEYLLPVFINDMVTRNQITVKLLETHDQWFGVTYKEDKESVVQSIQNLISDGIYTDNLFSSIKK